MTSGHCDILNSSLWLSPLWRFWSEPRFAYLFLYVFMVVLSWRIKRESGSSRHNNKFDTYCSFRACISSQHLTEVTVNRCSISQKLMIYWTREWIREWAFCRLITYWISLLNFKHEGLKHFTGKWHMSPYSSFLSCVDRSSENSLEW